MVLIISYFTPIIVVVPSSFGLIFVAINKDVLGGITIDEGYTVG